MKYKKVFCLFEQSGTFKGCFHELGVEAYDYDICNDYGQTDQVCDLFEEIDNAYFKHPSIFDQITQNDLILAFFPCDRFCFASDMVYRATNSHMLKKTDLERIEYSYRLGFMEFSQIYYPSFYRLYHICLTRGLHCIIENPYHERSKLIEFFPIKPSLIDHDRRKWGDDKPKPTMYYFINHKMNDDIIFEPITVKPTKKEHDLSKRERSEIHRDYAMRFIKEVI